MGAAIDCCLDTDSDSSTNARVGHEERVAEPLRPQGRAGHKDRVAELERAPPAAPEFWQRQGLRPHVVISTKFQEPWYTYSQDFKMMLMQLGCSVYNPNTDNVEICKAISKALSTEEEVNPDGRWLLTFNENVERVEAAKGFILQIQQGTAHQKSDMQKAEEMQTKWIKVPRIAVFAFERARDHVGGSDGAERCMETALAKAEEQWRNGIKAELQMCSERFEPGDGADKVPTDSDGSVHGKAKCTWPDGHVYVGEWQHGQQHGHGTYTWADGRVYLGEWQHGLMHGRGKVTNAESGDFMLVVWVAGKPSGEGVGFSKDRQNAWLLKDGEEVRELSRSEAAKKVEELGLSKL